MKKHRLRSQTGDSRDPEDKILSVVLEHDAELPLVDASELAGAAGVAAVFQPGEDVVLSLGTLLTAAGVDLDDVNPVARPSRPPGVLRLLFEQFE